MPSKFLAPSKLRSQIFVGLFGFSLLAFCFVNGRRLEDQRVKVNMSLNQNVYGKSLESLSLPFLKTQNNQQSKLNANWTLLVFVQTTCPACVDELRSLILFKNKVSQLRILPVIEKRASLDDSSEISSLVKQLCVDPIFDMDGSLFRECGNAEVTPYAVLIDSKSRIRFTLSGHNALTGGNSHLTECLESFFTRRISSHPLTRWQEISSLTEQKFYLSSGKQTSLAALSQSKVLVVTALLDGGPLSNIRIESLRPFFQAPNLEFLFVSSSPKAQYLVPIGMPQVAPAQARDVLQILGVGNGPSSQIIFRNRQLVTEEGEQSPVSIRLFDQELSFAALLSDAQWFQSQLDMKAKHNGREP